MTSGADIISEVDEAFMGCSKPEHFTNHTHCEECAEHDQLLKDSTRETIAIEDVGNPGWDPICFSDAAGIAYYFPALARLAITSRTYNYGWYGDQLMFHLTYKGSDNRLLRYCNLQQRRAVRHLLEYLQENRSQDIPGGVGPLTSVDEFVEARDLWAET